MTKSRAQKRFTESWVDIVLSVVSIIQGLAFNDLVVRLPDIYDFTVKTNNCLPLVHFFICFVILLRLFQTYVTAALDYEEWDISFFDMILIFVIGAAEYFLFSALVVPSFEIKTFHIRLSIISVLGVIGYLGAISRLNERMFPSPIDYRREKKLQLINISVIISVLVISICIILSNTTSDITYILLGITQSIALIFNIFYSMKTTFSSGTQTMISMPPITNPTASVSDPKVEVIIKPAGRENVTALLDLIMEHFSYVYIALFDTSPRLTRIILKDILISGNGKHAFGYRSFYLAFDKKEGKCVGMMMLDSGNTPGKRWLQFVTLIISIRVVFFKLGLVGLIRSFRNLKSLSTAIPFNTHNEFHIVYFAVTSTRQRMGIGKQMIDFVRALARTENKDSITLDVREINQDAYQFFVKQGFVDDSIIDSESDLAFGHGRRIRMKMAI